VAPSGGVGQAAKKKDNASDENDKEKEKLEDALGSAIVREKPNIKWADVAGLE